MRERIQKAVLHSAVEPTEAQKKRFEAFLRKKYGQAVLLQWEQDAALENGFRLEVGADLYDWSLEGRLRQFREQLEQLKPARNVRDSADAGGCPKLAAGGDAGRGGQRPDCGR